MYIERADRAVLNPKRRKIIEDFMANPKDPRYKQKLCAVPLTKKLVEETEEFMKLELSLLIFNFKDGTWNFKDKKYKKIQRPPPSSVVAPVDMRRGDSRNILVDSFVLWNEPQSKREPSYEIFVSNGMGDVSAVLEEVRVYYAITICEIFRRVLPKS